MSNRPYDIDPYAPYDAPLPVAVGGHLPSIPQLWQRARLYFARVISHIGSTSALAKRWRVTRSEKTELLGWLEPAEKLVRSCLIVRAMAFLMMTPEGRRLMREARKMAMPEPKKTDSTPPRITRIPIWHTHAPYARALAERQKLEEQKAAERAALDRHDPDNWGGGFRVIGWHMPDDHKRQPPKKKPPNWAMLLSVSLDPDPASAWRTRHQPARKETGERDSPALILARRIEAISRVIENPAPAVMRLARFLARLPREAIDLLKETTSGHRPCWKQGQLDARLGAAHVRRAASVYCHIEPG